MNREIKYYQPEDRRYFPENLQCINCGNTEAFYIDLRLRQSLQNQANGHILIDFDSKARKVFKSISENINKILNNGREVIFCANCGDTYLDNQEALLEYCWQTGCPGCDVCGNYIEEEELIDLCITCIRERDGDINEEKCTEVCEHNDYGLGEVRNHYGISLQRLKEEAGYD